MNGVYDSLPDPGKYIVSTIDARCNCWARS